MEFAPFRALRYSPAQVDDLDGVVSLPYDQFGPDGQRARYRRHPCHVVRLIRPMQEGEASQAALRRRARETFEEWRQRGVLAADPEPCFYPLRQRFGLPAAEGTRERWGCIGLVGLEALDGGTILPHEGTFPDTVEERRGLRRALEADLELVLLLVEDPDREVDELIRGLAGGSPEATARDESGTVNELWRVSDSRLQARLTETLAGRRAVIADGHHRYTAALAHWRERGADPADPAGWVLAVLVSQGSPGLTILPIHRLLRRRPEEAELLSLCGEGFTVEGLAAGTSAAGALEAATEALVRHRAEHLAVLVTREAEGLAVRALRAPRGSLLEAPWPGDVPRAWRELDVAVLQALVLGPLLGAELRRQRHEEGVLAFTNDGSEAVARVADGERGAAFLLNPLSLDEVLRVVDAGEVLPQKSTNFYPKATSGLAFRPFDLSSPRRRDTGRWTGT